MPITSIGIIVFRKKEKILNTRWHVKMFWLFRFYNVISIIEDTYLMTLINEMTVSEKDKLYSICKIVEDDNFNINVNGSLKKDIL